MFQSKLSAAREYKQKHHPQQQQHSNRSFSSYRRLSKTKDNVATAGAIITKENDNVSSISSNGTHNDPKKVPVVGNDVATSNMTHHGSMPYTSSSAASYYFHTAPHHQRPLSDLNHSFSSFYLYRNNNNNTVVAPPRPFVQESYQSIIQKNCSSTFAVASRDQSGVDLETKDNPTVSSAKNRSMTSRQSSRNNSQVAISYLQEAPTQSTESADSNSDNNSSSHGSDHNNHQNEGGDVSFSDRSSFWNEWAEELIHKEEVEYKNKNHPIDDDDDDDHPEEQMVKSFSGSVPHQLAKSSAMATGEVSVAYDDPTITFVDETPDTSFVDGHDSSIDDLSMNTGTASIPSFKILKLPPKTLSSQDRTFKNAIASSSNGMVYPPSLLVKNSNDSTEDDDEMLNHNDEVKAARTTVIDNIPEALVARNAGRALATPVDMTSPTTDKESEDNEMTPKVSGSRIVQVETLAVACPLPNDNDDTEMVSPMKSVMTEVLDDLHSNVIASDEEGEDEQQSIIQNTSISTLAAMNISQATIQLPTLTVFQQAMEYSSMATDYVQRKEYLLAMDYFQRAIDCYLMNQKKYLLDDPNATSGDSSTQRRPRLSILSAVNVAGCYRNMGTVSRLLEQSDEVTTYLCKAEDYYTMGRETVEIRSCESIVTLDGQLLNESTSLNGTNQQNTTCSYYTSSEDETMCLDGMILETIQSRAYYYTKYQDDKERAVECHEQCLKHLLHIYKMRGWSATKKDEMENQTEQDEEPIREQGVAFVPLSKEHHTSLLVKSLEALGNLYRSLVATSSKKACMILFEDAIDILQCRLEQEESANDDLIKSVSLILRYLSEIYFERQELDKAVDALHDSTAIKLTASGEPCSEALEVMDKMGAAHEQMENYDKALSCYEQTLFARCRFYGNTHFYVAKSLVNVARVTEMRDGSTQESVELYKAANAIFALHMLSDSPALDKDVENILQLIPTVIRQGRYEKAIGDLNLCLAMADEETNSEIKIDKAQIYFDLGRAYMGMKEYKLATTALMNAMKEAGEVKEEDIFTLLQRVEFLQREEHNKISHAQKPTSTAALSLSYAPDPTLSFHDITFQLQGDRSMYILDDAKAKSTYQEKAMEKVTLKSNDPLSDILYQSFIKDAEGPDIIAPTMASIPPPTVQDKTPLHARIRVKLSKKVDKLIAMIRAKCQKSVRLRNFKEFSKQCLKACKSKLRMGPQPAELNRSAGAKERATCLQLNGEDVVYASFEEPPPSKFRLAVTSIVTKCGLHGSCIMANSTDKRSRNIPFSFVHHHVIITEEDGGFDCQLIHA